MAVFGNLILTNAAETMTAEAWASAGTISAISVVGGSGFPGPSDNVETYTGLKTPVLNAVITGVNNIVAGQLTVRANFSSASPSGWIGTPATFNLNEIGVFASFNNGPSTLIAYCTTGSNIGDVITPTGGGVAVVKDYALLMIFSQAVSTSGTVQLLQTVGLHAINHTLPDGVDPIFIAGTPDPATGNISTGVVPIPSGSGGNVLCDTQPVSWIPYTPLITNNTTLYVALGNPDISPNFSSLANAFAYLNGFVIANGINVIIHVAAGIYLTSQLSINHVNGSQIQVLGPANPDVTFSGIGTPTGGAYNWNVNLTGVSSTANIATGNYLSIWAASGGSTWASQLLCGFHKVTAVSGNTVTILVKYRGASWPSTSGAFSGYISPVTALLSMTQNSGVSIGSHGINIWSGIGIIPSILPSVGQQFSGLNILGPCNVIRCGVAGFNSSNGYSATGQLVGFGISSAPVVFNRCSSSANQWGITSANGGVALCIYCACTHNAVWGYWGENGVISSNPDTSTNAICVSAGNGGHGMAISSTATLIAQGAWANNALISGNWVLVYNGGWGVVISDLSNAVQSSASNYVFSQFNTSGDITVETISNFNITITGSRVFNQAEGTLTANGLING